MSRPSQRSSEACRHRNMVRGITPILNLAKDTSRGGMIHDVSPAHRGVDSVQPSKARNALMSEGTIGEVFLLELDECSHLLLEHPGPGIGANLDLCFWKVEFAFPHASKLKFPARKQVPFRDAGQQL